MDIRHDKITFLEISLSDVVSDEFRSFVTTFAKTMIIFWLLNTFPTCDSDTLT